MSATNESRRNLFAGFFAAIFGGLFMRRAEASSPPSPVLSTEHDDFENHEVRQQRFVYDESGRLIQTTVIYGDFSEMTFHEVET